MGQGYQGAGAIVNVAKYINVYVKIVLPCVKGSTFKIDGFTHELRDFFFFFKINLVLLSVTISSYSWPLLIYHKNLITLLTLQIPMLYISCSKRTQFL